MQDTEEVFVYAKGYEKYFMVSNLGRILSLRTNKILKTTKTTNGYECFSTRLEGRHSKVICIRVHRLVLTSFSKQPSGKPFVNHKDGNKLNNKLLNLEWVTPSENVKHAFDLGLISSPKGEKHPRAILNKDLVTQIRALHKEKSFGKRKIAKILNLSVSSVNGVLYNNTWTHVK